MKTLSHVSVKTLPFSGKQRCIKLINFLNDVWRECIGAEDVGALQRRTEFFLLICNVPRAGYTRERLTPSGLCARIPIHKILLNTGATHDLCISLCLLLFFGDMIIIIIIIEKV